MFEVDKEILELRFNMQKVKSLEMMHKISLMSELSNSRGMLSIVLLEGLFSVGLFNTNTETSVKGKKAEEIFLKILEEEGFTNLNAVIIGKLQEDMGFLFLTN